MLRMAKKVKRVKREVNDVLYGKGYFVQEIAQRPVLQYQDPDGNWLDVPVVEISEESGEKEMSHGA